MELWDDIHEIRLTKCRPEMISWKFGSRLIRNNTCKIYSLTTDINGVIASLQEAYLPVKHPKLFEKQSTARQSYTTDSAPGAAI